jgi:hypothetical protein
MDSNITSSSAPLVDIEVLHKIENVIQNTTGLTSNGIVPIKRKRGNPSLKPRWVKGQSGNPSGRPKGSVSIKDTIIRKMNKENANRIADTLISGSILGEDKKITMVLQLNNDLVEAPTVSIHQNNNFTIPNEIIDRAREFAKIPYDVTDVIDVGSTPVSSSYLLSDELKRAEEFLMDNV